MRKKKEVVSPDVPTKPIKRRAGETGRLKSKDVKDWIWTYFDDTIKIFVPNELKSSFDLFLREHRYIKVKECAVYQLSANKNLVKRNLDYYMFRQGKDYIVNLEHREDLQTWLKSAIKEL